MCHIALGRIDDRAIGGTLFGDSVRILPIQGKEVIVINVPRAERGDKSVTVKVSQGKAVLCMDQKGDV